MSADPLQLLREARTIAMVGASPNPAKPSHDVMRYLLNVGYKVIPVRIDAEVGARSLWLQLGIRSPESRRVAAEAGLPYVEDECTAALHARHLR